MKDKFDTVQLIGYLAIVVIIVSIINLGMVFTGKATDTGIVNVTIESAAAINFTTDLIEFGSGAVATGKQNATLDTSAGANNVTNGNWTGNTAGFILENIGNVNVSLNLSSGKTAAQFLGGTSPLYQYNATNSESGSCLNSTGGTTGLNLGSFVTMSPTQSVVCGTFKFADASDVIRIDIKLVIPSDSLTGTQTDTVTATATSV